MGFCIRRDLGWACTGRKNNTVQCEGAKDRGKGRTWDGKNVVDAEDASFLARSSSTSQSPCKKVFVGVWCPLSHKAAIARSSRRPYCTICFSLNSRLKSPATMPLPPFSDTAQSIPSTAHQFLSLNRASFCGSGRCHFFALFGSLHSHHIQYSTTSYLDSSTYTALAYGSVSFAKSSSRACTTSLRNIHGYSPSIYTQII